MYCKRNMTLKVVHPVFEIRYLKSYEIIKYLKTNNKFSFNLNEILFKRYFQVTTNLVLSILKGGCTRFELLTLIGNHIKYFPSKTNVKL